MRTGPPGRGCSPSSAWSEMLTLSVGCRPGTLGSFRGARMLVYRLDTEEYIRRAVDATSRAYAGLIVVLARTAEARQAHEDLTRDWASFHDVTGRHVAVLCPAPR